MNKWNIANIVNFLNKHMYKSVQDWGKQISLEDNQKTYSIEIE